MAREQGYGQFCPVAIAARVLTERWVPLVVRELLCGSVRFNDLQRGVPRMSSSLLSRRLKQLELAGIIERRPGGHGGEYHLTDAGRELHPIIEGMGVWAQRWMRHELVADENLDPDLLMWDIRRNAVPEAPPRARRFVVRFELSGLPASGRRYWLVFDRGEIDLCVRDPGFEVGLSVACTVRVLTEVWLGHLPIGKAQRDRRLRIEGPREEVRRFADWFRLSTFAAAGRLPPGR